MVVTLKEWLNSFSIERNEDGCVLSYKTPIGKSVKLLSFEKEINSTMDEHRADIVATALWHLHNAFLEDISISIGKYKMSVKYNGARVFSINGGAFCYTQDDIRNIKERTALYFAIDTIRELGWEQLSVYDGKYDISVFDISLFEDVADGPFETASSDKALEEFIAIRDDKIEVDEYLRPLYFDGLPEDLDKEGLKDYIKEIPSYDDWDDKKTVVNFHLDGGSNLKSEG